MAKIAIITDTHFGVRGDAVMFLDYQNKFFENVFFPELEKRSINTVFHLGDLVDRRKFINFNTAARMRVDFLDRLSKLDVHIIVGNHDVFFKNTNDVNVFNEIVKHQYCFKVYEDPTQIAIDGTNIVIVPWINSSNQQRTIDLINSASASICFGHLELAGIEIDRGNVADFGLDRKLFSKFDVVCSGHYHHKSTNGNIHYLGAPYEITWVDYDDPKGFHVFDTRTRQLEFIRNPYSLFIKLYYNDEKYELQQMVDKLNQYSIEGSYVKIIVDNKQKPYIFDKFVTVVEEKIPYDIKIVETPQLLVYDDQVVDQTQDTMTIVRRSIDALDGIEKADKSKLTKVFTDLYNQANKMDI